MMNSASVAAAAAGDDDDDHDDDDDDDEAGVMWYDDVDMIRPASRPCSVHPHPTTCLHQHTHTHTHTSRQHHSTQLAFTHCIQLTATELVKPAIVPPTHPHPTFRPPILDVHP